MNQAWAEIPIEYIPSTLEFSNSVLDILTPEQRIIDVGCGVGLRTIHLCLAGYPNIAGVDLNSRAIAAAQGTAKALGVSQERFWVGDALDLTVRDGTFDVALMQALLTVVVPSEKRAAAVRQAHRILGPRGFLYVADFCQAWYRPEYRRRYAEGRTRYGEEGTFEVSCDASGKVTYLAHHFTQKEIVELITNEGFEIDLFEYRRVRTRSGNQILGFEAIARRV